jgi:hypothetical protein
MKSLNLKTSAVGVFFALCASVFAQSSTQSSTQSTPQSTSPISNLAQGTNVTCQAAPSQVPPLFLRGGMNGWTAQDDFEFVWDCNAFF